MNFSRVAAVLIASILIIYVCGCKSKERGVTSSAAYEAAAVTDVPETGSSSCESVMPTEEVLSGSDESVEITSSDSNKASPEPVKPENLTDEMMAELSSLSSKKIGWGHGLKRDSSNRPVNSVYAENTYSEFDARFIMDDEKKVYLTFDEGYENGYTGSILNTLKQKGVKAVFFVTLSYVKKNPDLVKRMINEGHIVGNHSSKHFSYPDVSVTEACADMKALHNYMIDNYGYVMTLFRFPKGEFSEQMLYMVKKQGYSSVFWSFAYVDWDENSQPEAEAAFSKITDSLHPGALYLLHAVSSTNDRILGRVIDDFRAKGYEIAEYPTKK